MCLLLGIPKFMSFLFSCLSSSKEGPNGDQFPTPNYPKNEKKTYQKLIFWLLFKRIKRSRGPRELPAATPWPPRSHPGAGPFRPPSKHENHEKSDVFINNLDDFSGHCDPLDPPIADTQFD